MPPDNGGMSTGSRKVESSRRSARGKGASRRRAARRAIARAVKTSVEIQGKSRARQSIRAKGEANRAATLDREVTGLRGEFNGNKREIFATGLVPDGHAYRGKTQGFK